MRERILFEGPSPKQNLPDYEFYAEGGSPKFTDFICDFIDQQKEQLEEINLALYLCNNKLMLESMIGSVLKAGITLNIFSIPLEGYDKTPAQSPTFAPKLSKNKALQSKQKKPFSKKDIAQYLYGRFAKSENPKINLYICDHMYIRSKYVKPFSRGRMPYSLHIKHLFIKFKSGSSHSMVTSSNMAVRDLIKHELLVHTENSEHDHQRCQEFFDHLKINSENIKHYEKKRGYSYQEKAQERLSSPSWDQGIYFTAHFLNESNTIVQDKIYTLIRNARKRVILCAQHINDQNLIPNHPDVELRVISQTYTDEHKIKKSGKHYVCINQQLVETRMPSNTTNFLQMVNFLKQRPNTAYYFNTSLHAKFIVVDDTIIISTGNLTETQFIYRYVASMNLVNMPDTTYEGTHSEVNAYYLSRNNPKLADELVTYFEVLTQCPLTHRTF
ncbi:hypothetical protein [Vibrio harveyi]|uniref:hypothetical protein n=1 Tax=Vibrio harveyi TaxID=669 RepID=UPI0005F0B11D|nr:hypothetical protein [Vibrio harveyi]